MRFSDIRHLVNEMEEFSPGLREIAWRHYQNGMSAQEIRSAFKAAKALVDRAITEIDLSAICATMSDAQRHAARDYLIEVAREAQSAAATLGASGEPRKHTKE